MKLSKAKELIEAGTHYLKCDILSELELEFNFTNFKRSYDYIYKKRYSVLDMKEIKLSDITDDDEEVQYQIKSCRGNWVDCPREIRIKPDYSKEIQEL